ncbi:MAG: YggS family pyridoxal phosphate-dependent enzyme [Candidatus Obscuribacterales bacterium]|nr:YggS family pyridoxal phosphate-dependent enzyme [Candidatus Obscuribacterales bacterium]
MAANIARIRKEFGDSKAALIAVSKYVGVEKMVEAFEVGVTEFGESRIQDALQKQTDVPPHMAEHIHWHFIGHLQTNKVKKTVGNFKLIHSVDSFRLAEEISKEAVRLGIVQAILLQAKIVRDENKSGFSPEDLKACFAQIMNLPGIKIEGLMTMSPLTDEKSVWRECFLGLKSLRDELEKSYSVSLPELSMGMSDDWIEALKCGATMVRIGRAIFENSEN